MIPGFYAYTFEILGDPYLKNDKVYNPYCNAHYTQLIGEAIDSNEQVSDMFIDASDLLINCKYKQPKCTKISSTNELSVLSLNVQSLRNKIDDLRENIDFYGKFDALLFNETNGMTTKLPNGIDGIF